MSFSKMEGPRQEADIHWHSEGHSDGWKDIREIAAMFAAEELSHIKTAAPTEHDNLLSLETFLETVKPLRPDLRVLAGAELTSACDLPVVGHYTLHTLVYFETEHGFDVAAFTPAQLDDFLGQVAEDYLPIMNRCVAAVNHKRLEMVRRKADDFFFEGRGVLTRDDIISAATQRLSRHVSADRMINLSNTAVAVNDTDVMQVVFQNMHHARPDVTAQTQGDLRPYFRRSGQCYSSPDPDHAFRTEDLISELYEASMTSRIRARTGPAHPANYVRVIARALARAGGSCARHVYDAEHVANASRLMADMIRRDHDGKRYSFIEASIPGFTFSPCSGPDDPDYPVSPIDPRKREGRSQAYAQALDNFFTTLQRNYWQSFARTEHLGISGGSDAHFRADTSQLGSAGYPDSMVGSIFCR